MHRQVIDTLHDYQVKSLATVNCRQIFSLPQASTDAKHELSSNAILKRSMQAALCCADSSGLVHAVVGRSTSGFIATRPPPAENRRLIFL